MSLNRVAELAREPRAGTICVQLSEIADLVGGTLVGKENPWITGVAGVEDAKVGDLTFLARRRYRAALAKSVASAVLVNRSEPVDRPAIRVDDPALAFLHVTRLFAAGLRLGVTPGVHPSAVVHESVQLGRGVFIGAQVVLEAGVRVGDQTVIMPGTVILHEVHIGERCVVQPNVTIYDHVQIGNRVMIHAGAVLGSDGFGYVPDGRELQKVPHIGNVVIEDDVEIGANSCIDRATTGTTRIGRGTKIDNLVQVAHNVRIGHSTVICAQTGISGSTQVGNWVRLGGQVGIVGHISVGDGASVGAQSGVTKSLQPGTSVIGYMAQERRHELRKRAALERLPELLATVRELRRRVAELEARESS